jgi:hypothetical protein
MLHIHKDDDGTSSLEMATTLCLYLQRRELSTEMRKMFACVARIHGNAR